MAYFLDPEKAYGAQPVTSGTATVPSSTSYAPAGAPQSEGQQGAMSTGGDFIGFDRYFAANKQAAQNTANQLAGGLETEGSKARAGIGQAQNNFNQAMGAGTVTYNPNAQIDPSVAAGTTQLGGGLAKSRQGLQGTPQQGAPPNPNMVTADEATKRAAQSYSGPTSMAAQPGYDALQKQVGAASERVNATKDTAGIGSLLQDRYAGQTGYTGQAGMPTGSSVLDANLANRAGGSRFQQLRSQYGGLADTLDRANKASADQATAAANASTAAAGQWGQLAQNYAAQQANGAAQTKAAGDAKAAAAAAAQKQTQDRWVAATKGHGGYDHRPSWAEWDAMNHDPFSTPLPRWFPDIDQNLYAHLSDDEVIQLMDAARRNDENASIVQQLKKKYGGGIIPWLQRK